MPTDSVLNKDMNTTSTALHSTLTTLGEQATAALPSGHTGAGDPLRRRTKIVNGHRVQALVIGWGEETPVYEVDHSTEPLTIEEAVRRVAA